MKSEGRVFPVLNPPRDCPRAVPWSALNEETAMRNHGQTLAALARRGGLDPSEICAVAECRRWLPMTEAQAVAVVRKIAGLSDQTSEGASYEPVTTLTDYPSCRRRDEI